MRGVELLPLSVGTLRAKRSCGSSSIPLPAAQAPNRPALECPIDEARLEGPTMRPMQLFQRTRGAPRPRWPLEHGKPLLAVQDAVQQPTSCHLAAIRALGDLSDAVQHISRGGVLLPGFRQAHVLPLFLAQDAFSPLLVLDPLDTASLLR
jgi:hypothetical protein